MTILQMFMIKRIMQMEMMERCDELAMEWMVFTTLCGFGRSRTERLPYQPEMHLISIDSTEHQGDEGWIF